jgi:hypothetical protein
MKYINIYSGMPNTKQIDLLYIMEELQDILDGKWITKLLENSS